MCGDWPLCVVLNSQTESSKVIILYVILFCTFTPNVFDIILIIIMYYHHRLHKESMIMSYYSIIFVFY